MLHGTVRPHEDRKQIQTLRYTWALVAGFGFASDIQKGTGCHAICSLLTPNSIDDLPSDHIKTSQ